MSDPIDKVVPIEFERLEPQEPMKLTIPLHTTVRLGKVVTYYPRWMLYVRDDGTLPWWFPLLKTWWWVQRRFRK